MCTLSKKSFLTFLSLFTVFSFFLLLSKPALAQSTEYQRAPLSNSQYIPNTSPHTASLSLYHFSHALSCVIIGESPIAPCLEYQLSESTSGLVKAVPVLSYVNTSGGVLGLTASALTSLYTVSPLDKQEYLAYLGKEVGLVSQANAQVGGSANSVLSPIFKLWQVSTQFAYLIMIIVFLIIGLMVMFRQKLNPQTVISIQLALPGLVIGLVLITFSYFLASLITDIAFIGTNVVGYYFSRVDSSATSTTDALSSLAKENVLSVMSRFASTADKYKWDDGINIMLNNLDGSAKSTMENVAVWISYQVQSPVSSGIGSLAGLGVAAIGLRRGGRNPFEDMGALGAGASIGEIITNVVGGGATALIVKTNTAPVLAYAVSWILFAILLFTMFRLLYVLIKNYLSLVFNTILAPFIFLAASLPGRQSLFTDWIRNMLCNALAFPAVIAMFYFAYFLLTGTTDIYANSDKSLAFSFDKLAGGIPGRNVSSGPGFTGQQTLPLFGGFNLDLIRYLLAYGALIATPSIPEIICKVLGKQGAAGQMLGGAIIGNVNSGQRYAAQYGGASVGGHLGAINPAYVKSFSKFQGFGDEKEYDYTHNAAGEEVWKVRSIRPGLRRKAAPPAFFHPEHHIAKEEVEQTRASVAPPSRIGFNQSGYDNMGGPPKGLPTPPNRSGR